MDQHSGATGARRTRLPSAERRETILRAAAEVFAETGYRAGKVSEIAARVGVSEPVIFQNFGSKAALFAAVLERAAGDARASLDGMTAAFGSPSALLAHVLSAAGQEGPGPAARHLGAADYGVLFADATTLAADPGLAGPAREALRAVASHLADLVRHAQAEGDVRDDAGPEAAAWLLLSVLSARRLRQAAMPGGLEAAVTDLVLQALAPRER